MADEFSRSTFVQRPGVRRALGSLVTNIDDLPEVIHVIRELDEEEERERARVAARTDLVHALRQKPGIYKALAIQHLGISATDAELLRAFALVDFPNKALRNAGFQFREVTSLMQLAPVAFQQPCRSKPKSETEQHDDKVLEQGHWLLMVFWVLAGLAFLTSIALSIGAFLKMLAQSSWTFGSCQIARFSAGHGNCSGQSCGFDVLIWEEGMKKIAHNARRVRNWKLPTNRATLTVEGTAFRCCNLDTSFQCCGWYDSGRNSYCDSWSYKVDESGRPCPDSPWACRFQKGDGSEGDIERLEETSADVDSPWQLGGAAIAMCVVAAGIAGCSAVTCCQLKVKWVGAMVRRICGCDDRTEQIAALEAAHKEAVDPILAAAKRHPRSSRRPPPPVNRSFSLPRAQKPAAQGARAQPASHVMDAWEVIDL